MAVHKHPKQKPIELRGNASPGQMTAKQEKFITEYLRCYNATAAARAAGCSPKNAGVMAMQWLDPTRYPHIREEIERRQKFHREQANLDAARLVQEWIAVGLFNARDLFNDDGSLKNISSLDQSVSSCIKKFRSRVVVEVREEMGDDGTVRATTKVTTTITDVEVYDKLKALRDLAEHLGYLKAPEVRANLNVFNWEQLVMNLPEGPLPDRVEEEVQRILSQPM